MYSFPFEHLTLWLDQRVYFSRVIHFFHMTVQLPIERNHDLQRRVVYVVNPGGDLPGTEETMMKHLSANLLWERLRPKQHDDSIILKRLKKGFVFVLADQLLRPWGW
jgi:hypothetical protein